MCDSQRLQFIATPRTAFPKTVSCERVQHSNAIERRFAKPAMHRQLPGYSVLEDHAARLRLAASPKVLQVPDESTAVDFRYPENPGDYHQPKLLPGHPLR